jgi:hypothetical protein
MTELVRTAGWSLIAALTWAGALSGAWAAAGGEFDKLAQSRFVHCAFYKSYEVDPENGNLLLVEGKSESLIHYQAIDRASAREINTRMAGSRSVRIIQTEKYLHYIDAVAGMYVVTTVYGCLERDERRGICVMYGAVNARHFDPRVLYEPDKVFEELRSASDPGFCDHSFISVQAATGAP